MCSKPKPFTDSSNGADKESEEGGEQGEESEDEAEWEDDGTVLGHFGGRRVILDSDEDEPKDTQSSNDSCPFDIVSDEHSENGNDNSTTRRKICVPPDSGDEGEVIYATDSIDQDASIKSAEDERGSIRRKTLVLSDSIEEDMTEDEGGNEDGRNRSDADNVRRKTLVLLDSDEEKEEKGKELSDQHVETKNHGLDDIPISTLATTGRRIIHDDDEDNDDTDDDEDEKNDGCENGGRDGTEKNTICYDFTSDDISKDTECQRQRSELPSQEVSDHISSPISTRSGADSKIIEASPTTPAIDPVQAFLNSPIPDSEWLQLLDQVEKLNVNEESILEGTKSGTLAKASNFNDDGDIDNLLKEQYICDNIERPWSSIPPSSREQVISILTKAHNVDENSANAWKSKAKLYLEALDICDDRQYVHSQLATLYAERT